MNWINATDKLPEDNDKVLVYCTWKEKDWSADLFFGYFREDQSAFYDFDGTVLFVSDSYAANIHWMPIDAIPKPEIK